jgi:DNA-binding CsgD family transcriptional regulator
VEGDADQGLAEARAAYARRDWVAARDGYAAARAGAELPPEDLAALSDAAWWTGDVSTSLDAAEEAYRRCLHGEERTRAAMNALEIAYTLFLRGDDVEGSGWLSRARRLLDGLIDDAAYGYLAYVGFEGVLADDAADPDAIAAAARTVQGYGGRFGDVTLTVLGTMGEGRALLRMGRVADGMALLDEAALALDDDTLAPQWAGNLYCHLVAACYEIGDVRRARGWTEALAAWCDAIAPAVVFTGICRVHRAQLFQLQGAWDRAATEATHVCDELVGIHTAIVAEGWYARGDVARLRGDLKTARQAYDRAREVGRDPQPGAALLLLAEGRIAEALSSIRAGLAVTSERLARTRLLPSAVTVMVAAGAIDDAAAAAGELDATANDLGTPTLRAAACAATGAIALARGDAATALPRLLESRRCWEDVGAPYEGAQARVLLAEAYRALGDEVAATTELDAARATLAALGAPSLPLGSIAALPDGLTDREAEVLRHVATGRTNREVARTLSISEKTVARHLSNVFTKTGVASRTEAAAYAFAHGIASPAHGSGHGPAHGPGHG